MIKAIETHYAGCHFRNHLVARWAVFFDTLGLQWDYEPEEFDLGEAGRYLPDFFLPESGWFVEVNRLTKISEEDKAKIQALDDYPPNYAMGVIVAMGVPDFPKEYLDQRWVFLQMIRPDTMSVTDFESGLESAINEARGARFENEGLRRGFFVCNGESSCD